MRILFGATVAAFSLLCVAIGNDDESKAADITRLDLLEKKLEQLKVEVKSERMRFRATLNGWFEEPLAWIAFRQWPGAHDIYNKVEEVSEEIKEISCRLDKGDDYQFRMARINWATPRPEAIERLSLRQLWKMRRWDSPAMEAEYEKVNKELNALCDERGMVIREIDRQATRWEDRRKVFEDLMGTPERLKAKERIDELLPIRDALLENHFKVSEESKRNKQTIVVGLPWGAFYP